MLGESLAIPEENPAALLSGSANDPHELEKQMASLSIKKAKRGVRSSLLLVLAAGVGLAVSHGIERLRLAAGVAQAQEESQKRITTSEGLPDFVGLVKRVGPVVVNVSTTQMRKTAQGPFGDDGPSG